MRLSLVEEKALKTRSKMIFRLLLMKGVDRVFPGPNLSTYAFIFKVKKVPFRACKSVVQKLFYVEQKVKTNSILVEKVKALVEHSQKIAVKVEQKKSAQKIW